MRAVTKFSPQTMELMRAVRQEAERLLRERRGDDQREAVKPVERVSIEVDTVTDVGEIDVRKEQVNLEADDETRR